MAIESSDIWDRAKAILIQKKAADKLKVYSDDDFNGRIISLANELMHNSVGSSSEILPAGSRFAALLSHAQS